MMLKCTHVRPWPPSWLLSFFSLSFVLVDISKQLFSGCLFFKSLLSRWMRHQNSFAMCNILAWRPTPAWTHDDEEEEADTATFPSSPVAKWEVRKQLNERERLYNAVSKNATKSRRSEGRDTETARWVYCSINKLQLNKLKRISDRQIFFSRGSKFNSLQIPCNEVPFLTIFQPKKEQKTQLKIIFKFIHFLPMNIASLKIAKT
jgi:hypothetical protein